MHRAVPLEPEKRLMLAVLEDAVICFQENLFARDKKKRQLFLETEQWIFEERSSRLFAFDNLCQAVDLNPRYIRRGLRRWQESRSKKQTNVSSNPPSPAKQSIRALMIRAENGKFKEQQKIY